MRLPSATSVLVATTPRLMWPVTDAPNCKCAEASSLPAMVMLPPLAACPPGLALVTMTAPAGTPENVNDKDSLPSPSASAAVT